MNLTNVIIDRPSEPNSILQSALVTLDRDTIRSLYEARGRAWQNETSGSRWFFQPIGTQTTDENIYFVYEESLTFL